MTGRNHDPGATTVLAKALIVKARGVLTLKNIVAALGAVAAGALYVAHLEARLDRIEHAQADTNARLKRIENVFDQAYLDKLNEHTQPARK